MSVSRRRAIYSDFGNALSETHHCGTIFVGRNLWDTCMLHKIDVGPASYGGAISAIRSDTWTEPLFGEGPGCGYDMVVLSGNGTDNIPPREENEMRQMRAYWQEWEIWPESRLSCCITLTKDMNGMVIYVPPRVEDNIG